MRNALRFPGPRSARWLFVLAAVVALAVPDAASATDHRLLTTTTLSQPSSQVISSTGTETLTATVTQGWAIGPEATVTFLDNGTSIAKVGLRTTDRSGHQVLCLVRLTPCTATVTLPASSFQSGDNSIVASYSGNLITQPSQSSPVVLYLGTDTPCTPTSNTLCTTPTLTSADGTTNATFTSSGTEQIIASFGSGPNQQLPCSTTYAGDVLAFQIINPAPVTSVELQVVGSAADQANANNGQICYEQPTSFTTAPGTPAAQLGPDGQYYGILPYCQDDDSDDVYPGEPNGDDEVVNPPPCVEYEVFNQGSEEAPDTYTAWFEVSEDGPRGGFI